MHAAMRLAAMRIWSSLLHHLKTRNKTFNETKTDLLLKDAIFIQLEYQAKLKWNQHRSLSSETYRVF